MAKSKSFYACQTCGQTSSKWVGRCPSCSEWNTFVEEVEATPDLVNKGGEHYRLESGGAVPLIDVDGAHVARLTSENSELDRVLGGGFVPGSLVLIGGDPGIGKSTLVLQALEALAARGLTVLYISGEESASQLKMRAERLGSLSSSLFVMAENNLETALAEAKRLKPALLVIDSIQTVYLPYLESAPGSVAQVRECTGKILYFSKSLGITSILIGHVTKDGNLAGPRMLEHMVDSVLYFEGDKGHGYRILRAIKNRYGSVNEIGVFEMSAKGLLPVENPSSLFLSERATRVAGSVVVASIEGTRPILGEVQALVSGSSLTNPRRTAIGADSGRLSLLVAVLEKVVGLPLYNQDIYVNVAGGLKISEPALDLAIVVALASSARNIAIDSKTVVFGEVGLAGEVRSVSAIEARLKEAKKLGFTTVVLPATSEKIDTPKGLSLVRVKSVRDALQRVFE